MIRLSVESDIKSIVSLWQEAFGDSEDEIMFFINNRYKPENTVVCEEGGKVVSMLFLLEGQMCIKGADYKAYYLYAACTSKEFRGRGLMASLLDYAKETAQSRGFKFICLKPAEESLFGFYEKHGYKSCFKQKTLTFYTRDLPEISSDLSAISSVESDKIRDFAFSDTDYFKWDDSAIDFAFRQTELYGGKVFKVCEGYLLYSVNDGVIHVKENAFTPENLPVVMAGIARDNKADKINVILPDNYSVKFGSVESVPSGMLLPLDLTAEKAIENSDSAYLGLTLD